MTLFQLFLALSALLLTPGPTNTLLAVAGAEAGFARALRLIPAEMAGYLVTTVPLAMFGAALIDGIPGAGTAMTGLAAFWVLWLAFGLWRKPDAERPVRVTGSKVFVTTLLNPKALIIGLVLLPGVSGLWHGVVLFAGLIALVAGLWAGVGAQLRGRSPAPGPRPLQRGAAVWLAALSLGLAVKAVAG